MGIAIVLSPNFTNYKIGLNKLGLDTLEKRREALCIKFAMNSAKSDQHSHLFSKYDKNRPNTKNKISYIEPTCRRSRYYKSAVPYLTRLLNSKPKISK